MLLYPTGHNIYSPDWTTLYFDFGISEEDSTETRFSAEVAFLHPEDSSRRISNKLSSRHHITGKCGWNKFCSVSWLPKYSQPFDRLTIEASVTIYRPTVSYDKKRWWAPKPSLVVDMTKLLKSSSGDVAFHLENDVVLNAHRCLLEVRAPALFCLTDQDAEREKGVPIVVPLTGVDARIFANVLEFIYTDVEPSDLDKCAEEYLRVANVSGVVRLKQLAEIRLANKLNGRNAVDTFLLADALDCAQLCDVAAEMIANSLSLVVSTPGWATLSQSPRLLLKILEAPRIAGTTTSPRKRRRVEELRIMCEGIGLETDGSREVLERRIDAYARNVDRPVPPQS